MSDGASREEQLRAAAKSDNVELATEVLKTAGSSKGVNVNAQDGLGMTALHYWCAQSAVFEACVSKSHSVQNGSYDVMELLLDTDGTDVDLQNRLENDTPLHLAARIQHADARKAFLASLLDAGADPRIRNKRKQQPIDLLPGDAQDERKILREFEAERSFALDNAVAQDDEGAEGASDED